MTKLTIPASSARTHNLEEQATRKKQNKYVYIINTHIYIHKRTTGNKMLSESDDTGNPHPYVAPGNRFTQLALLNLHCSTCRAHLAVLNLHCSICIGQFALLNLHCSICISQLELLNLHFSCCIAQFVLLNLPSPICIAQVALLNLHVQFALLNMHCSHC